MSKRIYIKNTTGIKDDAGIQKPAIAEEVPAIDDLMSCGLVAIRRTIDAVLRTTNNGNTPSREAVQNLKDCMAMLHELKKQEADLLEDMDDDQLEAIVKK